MPRKPKTPPITITGVDELKAAVRQAMGVMDDKEVAGIMLKGAQAMAKVVRRKAPKFRGVLRKAVRAKKSRKFPKHQPRAFAAIDRKKARHAHLVESGHAIVLGGKKGDGGRVVGHVPGKPFFRAAVTEAQGQVRAVVIKGLANGLNSIKVPRRRKKP